MSSLRARRMARNHRRMHTPAKLNLVALMDIFTILVLFLMVNNGDVEVLQSDRNIALPESVSELRPQESLTIKVTPEALQVQGETIMAMAAAMATEDMTLAPLQAALNYQAQLAGPLNDTASERGRSVIIMGDQSTPYAVLQRIMATCADADFRDISLAVNSVPELALAPATAESEI